MSMQEQAWPLDAQQSRSSDASAPVGILVSIHLIENLIRRLQGQRNSAQIKLPMDVTVEVKDVRIGRVVKRVVHMRNFTSKLFQLQRSSSSLVDVQFQEPLLSMIKSCPGNSRHWSVNESVTPPCLVLELWGNKEGEALDREDNQEEQQPLHRPVRQYVQQQPVQQYVEQQPVQYVEQRPLQPLHQPPPHQELRAEQDTRPSGRDHSNIHMTMKLVKSFFGDSVELPLQIVVDVPVEGMTQTAYLRAKGAKQAILCIEEPLRTKICSSQGRHRRWTLGDTLLNGLPCITLEMGATEGNSSKYVGANERWGKWRTVIKIHNKDYYLGTYITEEESARVYDSACYYLRGPKAKLNFPNEARQPLPDDLRAKIDAALSSVGNSKKAMAAAANAGLADAGWEMGDDDDIEEDEDDDDDGEDARHPLECQVSTVGHPLALSAPNPFSPDHYYPPYNLPSSSLGAGSMGTMPMGSFNINPAYTLSLSQMPPVAEVKQGVPLNDGTFGFGSFAFENAEEGSVPTKNDKNNYIFISMIIIKSFFGDLVELPFKVLVDAPAEGMSQQSFLRGQSMKQAYVRINEPLLSKIKSFSNHHRKWALGPPAPDGTPCLILELGSKDGAGSHYMGVVWERGRWRAQLTSNAMRFNLCSYSTEEEAAEVYDSAAHYLKGAQAKLNFRDRKPSPLSDELKAAIDAILAKKGKKAREDFNNDEDDDAYVEEEVEEGEEMVMEAEVEPAAAVATAAATAADEILYREETHSSVGSRIFISMAAIKGFLGESIKLPIKVMVECPDEAMRQLVWLRTMGLTRAAFFFNDPLLSKIKSCNFNYRRWSLGSLCGPDGHPVLILELGASRFMGVQLNRGKWVSRITANARKVHLGYFSSEEEAARVYDSACLYLRGPNASAKLNFPNEQPWPLADKHKEKIDATKDAPNRSRRRFDGDGEEDEDEEWDVDYSVSREERREVQPFEFEPNMINQPMLSLPLPSASVPNPYTSSHQFYHPANSASFDFDHNMMNRPLLSLPLSSSHSRYTSDQHGPSHQYYPPPVNAPYAPDRFYPPPAHALYAPQYSNLHHPVASDGSMPLLNAPSSYSHSQSLQSLPLQPVITDEQMAKRQRIRAEAEAASQQQQQQQQVTEPPPAPAPEAPVVKSTIYVQSARPASEPSYQNQTTFNPSHQLGILFGPPFTTGQPKPMLDLQGNIARELQLGAKGQPPQ